MLRPKHESSWVESVLKGRGRRSKVELEGFGVDWKGVEGVRGEKGGGEGQEGTALPELHSL